MRAIIFTETSECPCCGVAREAMGWEDYEVICEFLRARNMDPRETIRGLRENRYTVTWQHGGGYALADDDLLGGNGDGRTENAFRDWYAGKYGENVALRYEGTGRHRACRECSRYA